MHAADSAWRGSIDVAGSPPRRNPCDPEPDGQKGTNIQVRLVAKNECEKLMVVLSCMSVNEAARMIGRRFAGIFKRPAAIRSAQVRLSLSG
jgi:hypothetical protein